MSMPFCHEAGGRFFLAENKVPTNKLAFNQSCTRNSDSSAAKVEGNKFFDEVFEYVEKQKSTGNVSAVRNC